MTFISPLNPGEKLPQLPQRNAPTIETHICIEQKSTLLEWAVRAILKSKKNTRGCNFTHPHLTHLLYGRPLYLARGVEWWT